MQLTRWTIINREEFAKGSRPSKQEWCELIETQAVDGKIIAGTPYIDAARFVANTVMNPPGAYNSDMDVPDLLSYH